MLASQPNLLDLNAILCPSKIAYLCFGVTSEVLLCSTTSTKPTLQVSCIAAVHAVEGWDLAVPRDSGAVKLNHCNILIERVSVLTSLRPKSPIETGRTGIPGQCSACAVIDKMAC